jgi:hypothetical protein
MPRGYIGDNTHDRTVELLIAGRVLLRTPNGLANGERFPTLETLYRDLVTSELLQAERNTLRELAGARANQTLLSGQ